MTKNKTETFTRNSGDFYLGGFYDFGFCYGAPRLPGHTRYDEKRNRKKRLNKNYQRLKQVLLCYLCYVLMSFVFL